MREGAVFFKEAEPLVCPLFLPWENVDGLGRVCITITRAQNMNVHIGLVFTLVILGFFLLIPLVCYRQVFSAVSSNACQCVFHFFLVYPAAISYCTELFSSEIATTKVAAYD